MTNAEKYLKEGVSVEEFVKEIWGHSYNIPEARGDKDYKHCIMYGSEVERILNEPITPTLTEDERVILRNIENYIFIGRDRENALYVSDRTGIHSAYIDGLFDSLFQFIKERRRIFNRRIIRR